MSADKDSTNYEDEGDNAELDLSKLVPHKSGDPEADTAVGDEQPAEAAGDELSAEAPADDNPADDEQPAEATGDELSAEAPADDEQPAETDPEGGPEAVDDPDTLKAIVEAVLFVAPESMTPAQLSRAIGGTRATEVRQALKRLAAEYEQQERAFALVELAGGFQMMTRPEFEPYLRRFKKERDKGRLSPAALETLAIVAYRQPIVRAEIENLRGVGCGQLLRNLMDKRLVKIVGHSDVLGRPAQYGTTPQFLEHFGLNSLKDLPRSGELKAK